MQRPKHTKPPPLTQKQVETIIAFVKLKWGDNHPCPMCSFSDWGVISDVIALEPRDTTIGGPDRHVPIVPIMCKNCGSTVLVNAIVAGLVPPDTSEGAA